MCPVCQRTAPNGLEGLGMSLEGGFCPGNCSCSTRCHKLSGFKSTMILTTCWVCAAPLDQNWLGKCVRCDTRYCSQACLRQHPDEECRSISRGGGAEQYHADKKYKEAVAVAVEACAEDRRRARPGGRAAPPSIRRVKDISARIWPGPGDAGSRPGGATPGSANATQPKGWTCGTSRLGADPQLLENNWRI